MIENIVFPVEGTDQYTMFCSQSGRILEITGRLMELLETDVTGKNLNDIMEDRIAAGIIRKSDEDSVYQFDCVIAGRSFMGGSQISKSGRLVIVLGALVTDDKKRAGGSDVIRYTGRAINRNAESLNAAFFALRNEHSADAAYAKAIIRRCAMNLARISRNVMSRADFEEGESFMCPQKGDMLSEVRELFEHIKEQCGDEAIVTYECCEGSIESWYDSMALGKVILNVVAHSIIKARAQTAHIAMKADVKENNLVIQINSSFDLMETERIIYGENMELDVAVIYARKMHGSLVNSSVPGKGCSYRITLPFENEDEVEGLISNTVFDWYGGMDRVACELSGALTSERYYNV
ncbi:MAG: sensor histidine kinase [Clostridia bacterium]|nr:sensor histidine kinase [Clostridia bacterium]